ncbi:Protein of unknown function [Cotesia congregata]|uniref:Uncharacterized protein n=1 Tax=Cotesia congregata TaxID=51543 RepID=A0A8J2H6X2_COTCN|nr:Protein of unknown function [Cotesia congregata]
MQFLKIILCFCCVFIGHFSDGSNIHTSEIKMRLMNHTMLMMGSIDKGFMKNSNSLIISSDLFMPSKIRNIKSAIFILDHSEGPYDINASEVLRFFGSFDILVAYYVYLNYALVEVSIDKKLNGVYFNKYFSVTVEPYFSPSLYNRKKTFGCPTHSLEKSEELMNFKENYQNIYFDKTHYLDSHEIYLIAFIHLCRKGTFKDMGLNSLPDNMKLSASIHLHNYYFNLTLIKNSIDVKLHTPDTNYKLTDFITQYEEIHFSILTKKTDYLTAFREININLPLIFIAILMLVLIAVIIIINNQFHVSEGIMDIVSMSLSMGIMSPMQRLLMRIIYFFGDRRRSKVFAFKKSFNFKEMCDHSSTKFNCCLYLFD